MRFVEFARVCGIDIRRLRDDGKIHRCPTLEHPRSDNGAYAFDGKRGWCMAWDAGGETHWYGADPKEWTPEERAAWKDRQRAEYQAKLAGYANAARRAEELIGRCTMQEHGYLRLKGHGKTRGLVTGDDVLVVPMRNPRTARLQGAQLISYDGEQWVKKMLYGMKSKGAVMRLGPLRTTLTILCEGFATGLSIEAAVHQMRLRAEILVCFSDSNMVHVAETVNSPAIVAADNDASGAGERAAVATHRPYFMAPTVGWDANDWHQAEGLVPMCAAIMRARSEMEAKV